MPSFLDRSTWGTPIPVAEDLMALYYDKIDWNMILDYIERGQTVYSIGAASRRNFVIDYSGWDSALADNEVVSLALFDEMVSRNSYTIMPLLQDQVSLRYGDLIEVLRRYPRVFEQVRDDGHLMDLGFFKNQFQSACKIMDDSTHSLLWVLGEWLSNRYNWWSDSIPFVMDATARGLTFDEGIVYTTFGAHDAGAIQSAIINDIDPALMGIAVEA